MDYERIQKPQVPFYFLLIFGHNVLIYIFHSSSLIPMYYCYRNTKQRIVFKYCLLLFSFLASRVCKIQHFFFSKEKKLKNPTFFICQFHELHPQFASKFSPFSSFWCKHKDPVQDFCCYWIVHWLFESAGRWGVFTR